MIDPDILRVVEADSISNLVENILHLEVAENDIGNTLETEAHSVDNYRTKMSVTILTDI